MDVFRTSAPLTHGEKLTVVSINELKLHARILHDDENALLGHYIEAAYDYLSGPNGWLGRCCLLNETWEAYFDTTRRLVGRLELPMRPLASINTFSWLNSELEYEAVDPALYTEISENGVGALQHVYGKSYWSSYGYHNPRAFRVQFTAGFGSNGEDVPSPIRLGIKMLAAHYYQNRETTSVEQGTPLAYGLQSLCGRYRMPPDHS